MVLARGYGGRELSQGDEHWPSAAGTFLQAHRGDRVASFAPPFNVEEQVMPNELGYFTLPVKDLARAKHFYGALFGWEIEEGGHVANTKFPLGLSASGPAELPNAYFRVDDIDAAAARVGQLGGTVRARHVYPSGPNAVCADPDGTVFSLWQPAPGFE